MSRNKRELPDATIQSPVKPNDTFLSGFEHQTIWHLVLLILLPFFIFIKSAGYEFIDFDDVAIIKNNFHILGHLNNIGIAFKTDAFLKPHGDFYRPLQSLSFMLDYWLGGEKPLFYHLLNLIYHILTVVSLYYFLRLLKINQLASLFAALLFSVHPILASAVSWVPARGDIMIGLLGVQTMISFQKYFTTEKKIYLITHGALFLLALFSKEIAVLFPVLLLFQFFLLKKQNDKLTKLLPFLLIWSIAILIFFILRSNVVVYSQPDFIIGLTPFINNLPAIPIVLFKVLIPVNLSTMPLFESSFIFPGCIILGLMIVWSVKAAVKKNWLALFGITWFILLMIPPMFFRLFYSKYLLEYYEHRTYLPFMGLIIMLAVFFNQKLINSGKKIIPYAFAGILIIFSFIASSHSDHFKNSVNFFGRAADLNNPGAASRRGEIYFTQRDFPNAVADFDKAIELSDGEYPPAFFNRANYEASVLKDHQSAVKDYTSAIILDSILSGKISSAIKSPTYQEAFINRAAERIFTQDITGAYDDLAKAKLMDSSNQKIYTTLGSLYVNTVNYENAVNNFTKAIVLDSSNAESYNNRGFAYYKLNKYAEALKDYSKAIDMFPQYLNARYNKGMIYYETGQPEAAIKQFDTTLFLANNFYFGYFYRGMAKKEIHDMSGACKDWEESVKLGFSQAEDTLKFYCK